MCSIKTMTELNTEELLKEYAPKVFTWVTFTSEGNEDISEAIAAVKKATCITLTEDDVLTAWNHWADESIAALDSMPHRALKSTILDGILSHPYLDETRRSHAEMLKEALDCEDCM